MALDERANFAKGLLSAGINDSVTSLSLGSGEGALFPTPTVGYSCVIWDIDTYANPADDPGKEIVRVTGKSTDTFTITRAQESTSASAHSSGAGFMLTVTAKTIDDIETALGGKIDNLDNNVWLRAKNYAGTDYINMFKVNEDDEIDVGATLRLDSLETDADVGQATLINMPVSADATMGTEMSFVVNIDSNNILKIYAEADGSGGIQNPKVELLTKAKLTMQDSAGTKHTYQSDSDGSLIIT